MNPQEHLDNQLRKMVTRVAKRNPEVTVASVKTTIGEPVAMIQGNEGPITARVALTVLFTVLGIFPNYWGVLMLGAMPALGGFLMLFGGGWLVAAIWLWRNGLWNLPSPIVICENGFIWRIKKNYGIWRWDSLVAVEELQIRHEHLSITLPVVSAGSDYTLDYILENESGTVLNIRTNEFAETAKLGGYLAYACKRLQISWVVTERVRRNA